MTQTARPPHNSDEEGNASITRRAIEELGPWFHNLHLPDGSQTCPNHFFGDFPSWKWREIEPLIPRDLHGWRCLDIGCNAGFYSFQLAQRGADVLGIDLDDRYLRQARWAAAQFKMETRVRFEQMQVYDLTRRNEAFDLVLFMGVLYHLRYPMLGLDIVCRAVKRLLVFQTLLAPGVETFDTNQPWDFNNKQIFREPGWPKLAFIEHRFAGDPTNWWVANRPGAEAMLRSAGMRILGSAGDETYLCEPDPDNPSPISGWDSAEFHAATGTSGKSSAGGADA